MTRSLLLSKGIYCAAFSNGQVNIGGGDFAFYVKQGFLIEDGKLTQPIKDVNVIGNGPDSLSKMDMIGNDMVVEGGWTCVKTDKVYQFHKVCRLSVCPL